VGVYWYAHYNVSKYGFVSVGEAQASLAAFLAIISLLRQMPTISMPRKKLWKPSREEVRSSFIGRVATVSDIERYCADRKDLVAELT
jgi:hypothetical protein